MPGPSLDIRIWRLQTVLAPKGLTCLLHLDCLSVAVIHGTDVVLTFAHRLQFRHSFKLTSAQRVVLAGVQNYSNAWGVQCWLRYYELWRTLEVIKSIKNICRYYCHYLMKLVEINIYWMLSRFIHVVFALKQPLKEQAFVRDDNGSSQNDTKDKQEPDNEPSRSQLKTCKQEPGSLV